MIFLSRREAERTAKRSANHYGVSYVTIYDRTYDMWFAEPASQFESIRKHWAEQYTADLIVDTYFFPDGVDYEELRIPLC